MNTTRDTTSDKTNTQAPMRNVIGVVAWHSVLLIIETSALILMLYQPLPNWIKPYETALFCGIAGGFGGIVYCLRGVYLNVCVRNSWESKWIVWHIIRPVLSIICGVISFLLLKAGLILLDASPNPDNNYYGFYMFAFVAGLNVDKFLQKIEDIAQTTWGIDKTRAGKDSSKDDAKRE